MAAADQRAGIWQKASSEAVQDDNMYMRQRSLHAGLDERIPDEQATQQ
ncbi:hypothetical protein AB4Y45_26695 [Paraburkholderia sp. EG287A]